jgi:hypothetical protein
MLPKGTDIFSGCLLAYLIKFNRKNCLEEVIPGFERFVLEEGLWRKGKVRVHIFLNCLLHIDNYKVNSKIPNINS